MFFTYYATYVGTNEDEFLNSFYAAISGMSVTLNKVVGPVIEAGVLATSNLPILHFSEDSNTFKPAHRSFSSYQHIRELQSDGDVRGFGCTLFQFLYKLVLYAFVTLPFMGGKPHEVVEVVWSVLEVFPEWGKLCHHNGDENMYLMLNYAIRYATRKGVKHRSVYFMNLYLEMLPNSLQSIVFKVITYSIILSVLLNVDLVSMLIFSQYTKS